MNHQKNIIYIVDSALSDAGINKLDLVSKGGVIGEKF